MAYREYIGSRYIPIFGRKNETSIEWDNTKPYEPLTIVLYQGNSYTSRQNVPAGIDITNETYWALTGNYNSQVEQYRQEVTYYNNRITDLENNFPVNSTDIANSAITADKIASSAITADKIASSAVTSDKIASSAITADKIASSAITADKIANGAITPDKIQSGSVSGMPDYANTVNVTTSGTTQYMQIHNDGVLHPFACTDSDIIDSNGTVLQNGFIEFRFSSLPQGTITRLWNVYGYINNVWAWHDQVYQDSNGNEMYAPEIVSGLYPVSIGDVIGYKVTTYRVGTEKTDGNDTGYVYLRFIPNA